MCVCIYMYVYIIISVVNFGLRYTTWTFHVHLLPVSFQNMVFMILYFLDVAHSASFVSQFKPKFAHCDFHRGFVLFPIFTLKSHYYRVRSASLKSHRHHCRSYLGLLKSALSLVCSALLCTEQVLLLWG